MITFNGRPDSGSSSEKPRAYKRGPSQGSSQAPSYAELRRPTLSSSSISLDTNVTTSVPIMVRPWLDGWEKNMKQGSFLFVLKSINSRQMHVCADLPTINYLLERSFSTYPDDRRQEEVHAKELSEFDWELFGVVRNDLMAGSSLQKLYNVDVHGRSMVANVFGKVKRSDHVGLALVSVPAGMYYQNLFLMPNGNARPGSLTSAKGNAQHLQIIGTVNGKIDSAFDLPGVEVLRHYPLGVVSHAVAKIPTQGSIKRSIRNQDQFTLLPKIEILMI